MRKPQGSSTRQELEQLPEDSGKAPSRIQPFLGGFPQGRAVGPEVGERGWGMESLECSPGNGCEGPRGTRGTSSTGMCWHGSMRNSRMHWERQEYWDALGTSGSLGRAPGHTGSTGNGGNTGMHQEH